jgi:hypothetical protein
VSPEETDWWHWWGVTDSTFGKLQWCRTVDRTWSFRVVRMSLFTQSTLVGEWVELRRSLFWINGADIGSRLFTPKLIPCFNQDLDAQPRPCWLLWVICFVIDLFHHAEGSDLEKTRNSAWVRCWLLEHSHG